jgi:glyoxylate reductase
MNPQRIVVTRTIPEVAIRRLEEAGNVSLPARDAPLTREALCEAVSGADAIVTMLHDRIDDAVLDAAGPQLRIVANVAVGYDNIDVAACERRGVLVSNTPGVLVDATADHAMALMLAVTRRIAEGDRLLRNRQQWSWAMTFMLGTGLQG